MDQQASLNAVQQAYMAFGRGDIPGVLAMMADNVEFNIHFPPSVPLSGTYNGLAEAGQYFQALGSTVEITMFQPKTFMADGDTVVVLGSERSVIRASGAVFEHDWVHVWRMNNGKFVRFDEYGNSKILHAAFTA